MLSKSQDDEIVVNSIGIVPIFEILRKEQIEGCHIGVISGTLMILPNDSLEPLKLLLKENQIQEKYAKIKSLSTDNYFELELTGESNKQKVSIISTLFRMGEINVLIGTKSLLGEGWDEPSINTLIIASFVGSYMLSNQMRGRAIRIDPKDPLKVANIWHLVCVENESWYQNNLVNQLTEKINHQLEHGKDTLVSQDYETLIRRFKGFVGVSYTQNIIESGIDRLSIIKPPFDDMNIKKINQEMIEIAKNRNQLRKNWHEALKGGFNYANMIEEIRIDKEVLPRKFIYIDSIMFLLLQSVIGFNAISPHLINGSINLKILSVFLGVAVILWFPRTIKAILLLIRFGSLKGSFKGIGKSILDTLRYLDLVQSPLAKVNVEKVNRYDISCYLSNASSYEKNLFNECLEDIAKLIDNPRYLIERSGISGFFRTKDFVAIPKVFAKNKDSAEFFSKRWNHHVGPNRLIYTRDIAGRKQLLKARIKSLSYQSLNRIDRKKVFKNKWQ